MKTQTIKELGDVILESPNGEKLAVTIKKSGFEIDYMTKIISVFA